MCLLDVYGDGDSKLIVADADKRLKMFKGSSYVLAFVLFDKIQSLIGVHFVATRLFAARRASDSGGTIGAELLLLWSVRTVRHSQFIALQ